MKPRTTPLQSRRLELRLLEEYDLDDTLRWRNKPDVRRQFFYDKAIVREDHLNWFSAYLDKSDDLVFICTELGSGNRVAQTSFYNFSADNSSAEFGRFLLSDSIEGSKGWGTEAMALTCELGFKQLLLRNIHLEVKEDNKQAIAVYRKLGFTLSKECSGCISMGLNASEWKGHESFMPH